MHAHVPPHANSVRLCTQPVCLHCARSCGPPARVWLQSRSTQPMHRTWLRSQGTSWTQCMPCSQMPGTLLRALPWCALFRHVCCSNLLRWR